MSPANPKRADKEPLASGSSADDANENLIDQETRHFGVSDAPQESPNEFETLAGERGASALHRARSLQSRASQVLALSLMGALAIGLLGWYYLHTFAARGSAHRTAQTASRNQAAGDAPLPSLGPITLPEVPVEKILGPAPDESPISHEPGVALASVASPVVGTTQPTIKSPAEIALDRRLTGPAFSRRSDSDSDAASTTPTIASASASSTSTAIGSAGANLSEREVANTGSSALQDLLKPSLTPAVRAQVLPTQRLLLPKGAFIDCTLETAIDSTLPGMTTCITATDTFSADGSTVLLERGTKLVGETRGGASQGAARVFVLWSEARTPTGVVIPLDSPGTDELGRSGLAGNVNRHFFQRFGAAILISLISGAVQGAVASQSSGSTVVYNPSGSQDVMSEVLKDTINIPPTITKNQGDRIQVLVARDLDFRSVYELKPNAP
jgi:type IV secretion system protein VirB10